MSWVVPSCSSRDATPDCLWPRTKPQLIMRDQGVQPAFTYKEEQGKSLGLLYISPFPACKEQHPNLECWDLSTKQVEKSASRRGSPLVTSISSCCTCNIISHHSPGCPCTSPLLHKLSWLCGDGLRFCSSHICCLFA